MKDQINDLSLRFRDKEIESIYRDELHVDIVNNMKIFTVFCSISFLAIGLLELKAPELGVLSLLRISVPCLTPLLLIVSLCLLVNSTTFSLIYAPIIMIYCSSL